MVQNDSLEPSATQASDTIHRSRQYWHSLLSHSISEHGLPLSCNNFDVLLHDTPAIPHHSEVEDILERGSLYLEGFSVWGIGSTGCDIDGQQKVSRTSKISLGIRQPLRCHVTKDVFWPGFEGSRKSTTGNFVFAMVLGWCYVLSARHIELRRVSDADSMFYTENQAPIIIEGESVSDNSHAIPIHSPDPAECRWWAAVLAPECGWQAVMPRSGSVFYTPWSCHLGNDSQFKICYSNIASNRPQISPPSSAQAREYLISFAERHNAHDQLLAAFAASLTIPPHGRFGTAVSLPAPVISSGDCKTRICLNGIPSIDQLSHFMALSSIPNTLISSVFGCFWESGVECNLVSEWLSPLLQECIPSLLSTNRHDTIVRMMANRRPNSAPLWSGLLITGMIPRIFDIARKIIPSISLAATHWIASPQSFMDPIQYEKPQILELPNTRGSIRREDEFRLLFLTDTESTRYPSPPSCPWAPFGTVNIETCAIEVQRHSQCGHRLVYQHWTWIGRDGKQQNDCGLMLPPATLSRRLLQAFCGLIGTLFRILNILKRCHTMETKLMPNKFVQDQDLSRLATRNIFTWTLSDGTRPEDAEYWKHDWLEGLLDGSEDDES